MNSRIQRMQRKLDEQLSSQEKHLKKAQEAAAAAEQLKKNILFEENNAIAMRVREVGINFEEFDAMVDLYRKHREDTAESGSVADNEADALPASQAQTPETAGSDPSPAQKDDELKEDLDHETEQ